MEWTEFIVTVPRAHAEAATAVGTALCDGGLYIEDYADLERQVYEIAHVDLIEQELLDRPRDEIKLHLYVSPDDDPAAMAGALHGRLLAAGVQYTLHTQGVKQEDWENAWKRHYHPFTVGGRLAVAPSWEDYKTERTLLRIDPGMAFGTGTHETTALCLQVLDEVVRGGEQVLDVGCGSGILGIAAALLGAAGALCIDIDAMAVRTATENAQRNGVESIVVAKQGDLAGAATGRYEIITANIVADAIMRLAPDIPARLAPGGLFVASGIIDERAGEVQAALQAAHLAIRQVRQAAGWVAILAGAE